MIYRNLADLVFILHFCYVVFVIFGGLLILRWRWIFWIHLPAVIWAVIVEFFQLHCPLTTWENHLKQLGGGQGYEGGFIEYYVSAILYMPITPQIQIMLGVLVILINSVVYSYVFRSRRYLS
jgi:hypothetical protein